MFPRDAKPLRLAIISSPRTGNNWLQNLLGRIYRVPGLSPTNPSNVRWHALPQRCVLILHWPPTTELRALLDEHGFRVLSLARHPLDVLVSILHFGLREPTDGWLEGEGGSEQSILGRGPTSQAFLDYACGPRARALLDVSAAWWQVPACRRVRYEDLVADPTGTLRELVHDLGEPCNSIDSAVSATSLDLLRGQFADRTHHFWQGKPGLWRALLPAAHALHIAREQERCFSAVGYDCEPDLDLTSEQAEGHWREMIGVPAGEDVLQRALTEVKRDLEVTRARLAELEAMGPTALQIAGTMKAWTGRFPRLTGVVKRFMRRYV